MASGAGVCQAAPMVKKAPLPRFVGMVHLDALPGAPLFGGDMAAVVAHARADGIKFVFVQPQFSARSAKLIAGEIGGQVVIADPLAEDWADNLRGVARKFETALR